MASAPPIIVLAAGMGLRLGHDLPKCLVKLGNESIIDHQLRNFETAGVRDVWMVVGFQAEKVRDHVRAINPRVRFVENKAFMDTQTGKSLLVALEALGDKAFLQINGDVAFDAAILNRLTERPHVTKLAARAGVVGEEEIKYSLHEGRVMELSKKVAGGAGEAVGINYFAKPDAPLMRRALEYIAPGAYFERAIEHMLPFTKQPVECMPIEPLRAMEIDFPEDLEAARKLFAQKP